MTKQKKCGATFDAEDATFTCALPEGHPGPVHEDDGHAWADALLPLPEEG